MASVDSVKAAIRKFEELQDSLRKYGAGDTEPDMVFQYTLWTYWQTGKADFPVSGEDWMLFTRTRRCGNAARRLTAQLRKVLRCIDRCPLGARTAVGNYLCTYCWRMA